MRSLIDGADDNATLTSDENDSYHSSLFHCFKLWIEWIGRDIVSVGCISDGQEQDTDAPALWMWPWYTRSRHINTRRSCKCGSSHRIALFQLTWSPVIIRCICYKKHCWVTSIEGRLTLSDGWFLTTVLMFWYTQFKNLSVSTMKGKEM